MLTVHMNSSVKTLGRKIISGDVIELPHLKDEYALNDYSVALKRFYVVEDVNRAAEGFSQTWYPHLYRLKLKQIVRRSRICRNTRLTCRRRVQAVIHCVIYFQHTKRNAN